MATNNIEFNYKRNDDFQEPGEEPAIRNFESYGQLSDISQDPNWMKTRLYSIYSEAEPLLNSLSERSKSVTALELDQYKPEVQEERKRAYIKEHFERILKLIQTERVRAGEAVENMKKYILNFSKPKPPKDLGDRFSFDSMNAEIRMLIRSQSDMQGRIAMVTKALENDNSAFMLAAISSPDEIIPKARLNEIRRQFAFKENPSLQEAEADAIKIEKSIERRTSEISGTATKILMSNGQDMPLTKAEFFAYFPPKDELDGARKQRMLDSEADLQRRRKQAQDFDEQHIGVAM